MAIDIFKDTKTGEERIVINYRKLQDKIKKCKEEKDNKSCKIALQEIGIEWLD